MFREILQMNPTSGRGDAVVVVDHEHDIRSHSDKQTVIEAKKCFCNAIRADVSLVDTLMRERHISSVVVET